MNNIETMKSLLSYNANTGEFMWTDKAPHKVAGKPANAKDSLGYICLRIDGKMYKAHRIAWAFVYGEWPELHIDHINGDPSDNRICNLREVDRHANMQNERKARLNNKSGYLGVCPNGGNWRAEIRVDGKKINLGTYKTPVEAHEAYVVAKRKFHEGATL
jgi:hypothetical protein